MYDDRDTIIIERFNVIISQLGGEVGIADLCADEDGLCRLDIDNIPVSILKRDHNIVLFAELGPIPEKHKIELYERLLDANFLWRHTLGCTLAVRASTGEAMIQAQREIDQMSHQDMMTWLAQFVDMAELWRISLDTRAIALCCILLNVCLKEQIFAVSQIGQSPHFPPSDAAFIA